MLARNAGDPLTCRASTTCTSYRMSFLCSGIGNLKKNFVQRASTSLAKWQFGRKQQNKNGKTRKQHSAGVTSLSVLNWRKSIHTNVCQVLCVSELLRLSPFQNVMKLETALKPSGQWEVSRSSAVSTDQFQQDIMAKIIYLICASTLSESFGQSPQ